jgi:mannose-6-phosphate isomerase-like protein (cupin superfamily)
LRVGSHYTRRVPGDELSSPNLTGLESFAVEPERIEKPWGYELIWALTDKYCGKLLHVRAGEQLSLQFHKVKDEAWLVYEGKAEVELAPAGGALPTSEVVGPGAAFHFEPGTVHRVQALEDTTILEVSTPELDDVVRLDDRYGRAGAPAIDEP